jgi:hypothetical protein
MYRERRNLLCLKYGNVKSVTDTIKHLHRQTVCVFGSATCCDYQVRYPCIIKKIMNTAYNIQLNNDVSDFKIMPCESVSRRAR